MGWQDAGKLAATLALGGVLWQGVTAGARSKPIHAGKPLFRTRVREIGYSLVQANRTALFVGGAALFLILPLFLNNYYIDILSLAGLYALLAAGLNITVGYAGLLDLGYAGFYGVGAYVYALLSTGIGLSFWLGLPLGGAIAAAFGVILGVITLRLRGDYLAIVTLGFVQIVYLVFNNWDSVTNGPNGILNIGRPALPGLTFRQPIHFYYLVLLLLFLVVTAIHRLTRSQIGRAWIAIREDELAASAMGINTTRMKVLAFALGAGIAGVAGVFFAAKYSFVSPESFTFLESVRVLSMVVLGGMGSLPGAVLGAFLLTVLPELLRGLAGYRMLIFGAALVVMMIFRPQGLLGKRH
ncbi:MAG: branched-chain amino acid ABC transporter permease [Candidatus Manganitrophaceae bacterium]|nr:MAG: branched-chain amino acid ABC transporter permease [Candidatus Manganitrophaceae bacterium]